MGKINATNATSGRLIAMTIHRRTLLKGAAATAGMTLAAPFVSRSFAQATSGQVNIFAWAGYRNDESLGAFEKATWIKANYTPVVSNDRLTNLLPANHCR